MDYKEVAVTAMIRSMGQSIKNAFMEFMHDVYFNDKKSADYKESCLKWHKILIQSCSDMSEADEYIAIIQDAYNDKRNLDEDEDWLLMMRLFLPTQFMKKMKNEFTQVPGLAMMDPSDYDPLKNKEALSDFKRLDLS